MERNELRNLLRERLIVALDVPEEKTALELVETLGESVKFYKIGLQLLTVGGIDLAKKLEAKKKDVFLDYKLFDIGVTIFNAVESIQKKAEVRFLTVQGDEEIIKNAVKATVGKRSLGILAVTIPTSWNEEYLKKLGVGKTLKDLVLTRARMAMDLGCEGVIASPLEAEQIRQELGENIVIVTPGIRPAGSPQDDQQRVSTPANAIAAGADYIVVGRPITRAPDPRAAAEAIIDDMVEGAISSGRTLIAR
jgi:orotidine-5'-phosphate decarboxylase